MTSPPSTSLQDPMLKWVRWGVARSSQFGEYKTGPGIPDRGLEDAIAADKPLPDAVADLFAGSRVAVAWADSQSELGQKRSKTANLSRLPTRHSGASKWCCSYSGLQCHGFCQCRVQNRCVT
eukprot:478951-Rhodomonas_salina.3